MREVGKRDDGVLADTQHLAQHLAPDEISRAVFNSVGVTEQKGSAFCGDGALELGLLLKFLGLLDLGLVLGEGPEHRAGPDDALGGLLLVGLERVDLAVGGLTAHATIVVVGRVGPPLVIERDQLTAKVEALTAELAEAKAAAKKGGKK